MELVSRAKMKPAELAKQRFKADICAMRRDWKVKTACSSSDGTGYDNICTEKPYGDFEMYRDWMTDGKELMPASICAARRKYRCGYVSVDVGAQVGSGGLWLTTRRIRANRSPWQTNAGRNGTRCTKWCGRPRDWVRLNGILGCDNIVMENHDQSQPVPALEQIELQAHGSKVHTSRPM